MCQDAAPYRFRTHVDVFRRALLGDPPAGVQSEHRTREGGPTIDTALGVASVDYEGLYRVEHHGHRVIWVPAGADSLKKRLLVCAHLEGVGHRGVDATMARLERQCV